ncbi:hypothetical protein Ais01nite_58190 [Asanoa ishikariensis]|uniref:DUF2630 domain-containing protein n=1 Tax=Asanoa ishikariensis TaxID=137265 RepID=A0A1H3V045_9ACTN|nr:DUF2630 family protein [Asanoa ishikariensis]GIF67784.1 hypothetical protein Ais01nite_58190 [Asanoa ishikariensis]SDZ67958.1 Protein of unknown function [Asanoa ishikariensis]
MDDKTVLTRINDLVQEEHQLRTQVQSGQISSDDERTRLRQLEESLDQCWDLLRRRRAARAAGADPDAINAEPVSEVEGYLQ